MLKKKSPNIIIFQVMDKIIFLSRLGPVSPTHVAMEVT